MSYGKMNGDEFFSIFLSFKRFSSIRFCRLFVELVQGMCYSKMNGIKIFFDFVEFFRFLFRPILRFIEI